MDVVMMVFYGFFATCGLMFVLMFNRIWKMRARMDEEELALRKQELEVRKQFVAILSDEERKALNKAIQPYLDLLRYEIETRAEAQAEAIYTEMRLRLGLPTREESDDRPTE